jgi:hypothetical protein
MCCIATACPEVLKPEFSFLGAKQGKPCPALIHNPEGQFVCGLVVAYPKKAKTMGIGAGCCFLGHAMNAETGVQADFAGLPPDFKIELAQRALSARKAST